MSNERQKILSMIAEGKLTVDEAEKLLDALGKPKKENTEKVFETETVVVEKKFLKFLRVVVESKDGDNVNIRVPMALLRAGLKLSALIPPLAYQKLSQTMSEKGVDIDLNQLLKSGNMDEVIESMGELNVDVNSADGDQVRIFFE